MIAAALCIVACYWTEPISYTRYGPVVECDIHYSSPLLGVDRVVAVWDLVTDGGVCSDASL